MFEARGFTSLQVEIRNPERLTTGSILSESADEKTVASYKSIEQDLLSIIVELGSICLAFGLIMSGNPDRKETFCPTIVVYVKDGSIYDWGRFLDACRRISAPQGLKVMLQPGILSSTATNQAGHTPLKPLPPMFSRKAKNGASVGIMDQSASSGTLGAYVVLQSIEVVESPSILCALTDHHVVSPAESSLASQIYRTGITPSFQGLGGGKI